MDQTLRFDLGLVFQAVLEVMEQNRLKFNQSDPINGNHGDHMVAVFQTAARAAASYEHNSPAAPAEADRPSNNLAEAIELAAQQLRENADNETARIYAHGLTQLATQFRRYNIEMADLVPYVQSVVQDSKPAEGEGVIRSGDILKSLLTGLAGWRLPENDQEKQASPLDMGAMFDLGIAYLQAKQRNPTRLEAIADAAASVSPLSSTPHRYQSSKTAFLALLNALAEAVPHQ